MKLFVLVAFFAAPSLALADWSPSKDARPAVVQKLPRGYESQILVGSKDAPQTAKSPVALPVSKLK